LAHEFADAGAVVTITGRRARAADYETDLSRFRYLQLEVSDNAQVTRSPPGSNGSTSWSTTPASRFRAAAISGTPITSSSRSRST